MEERKNILKPRNFDSNLYTHKSVTFNDINSTKIVPQLLTIRDKIETEKNKTKKPFNYKVFKSSNTLFQGGKQINSLNTFNSSNSLSKRISSSHNEEKIERGISNKSLNSPNFNFGNSVNRLKSRGQIKRLNSININVLNKNLLGNLLNKEENKKNISFYNNKNLDENRHRNSFSNRINTEIKNYNLKNNNINNMRRTTFIRHNNEQNDKTKLLLKRLYTKNFRISKPKKITNPLEIPEEDQIFEETKKYLCYKYESMRLRTYNNRNNNYKKSKENKTESKIKKIKQELKTSDKIRLNYLYLSTNKISNKLYYIKRQKEKKDLNLYQKHLLDIVKPSLSDYSYMYLKDRLFNIRKKINKTYQNNYKKLKEIENDEEEIINQFNETCTKCVKQFKKAKEDKILLHSANLKIKLPTMNFVSCLKKYKANNNKNKTKTNFYKTKTNMNKNKSIKSSKKIKKDKN